MSLSLFPQTSNANSPPPALSINAGKCLMQQQPNGMFLVTPEKRRGQILLVKKNDLLHFQWKDRSSGIVEDDRIVFPSDASFKKVKTGKEDRVYLLQVGGTTRFMFWMQDKDASKDEENCNKLNQYMDNPNSIPAAVPPAAQSNNAETESLLRMLGLPPRAAPQSVSAPTASAPTFNGLDLSSIIRNIATANASSAPASSSAPPPPIETSPMSPGGISSADLQSAMTGDTSIIHMQTDEDIPVAEVVDNNIEAPVVDSVSSLTPDESESKSNAENENQARDENDMNTDET